MSSVSKKRRLYVEGKDDEKTIEHLLRRHGINCDAKSEIHPEIKPITGNSTMLALMREAIKNSRPEPVGFVIDADSPLKSRWDAVRGRLNNVGVADLPKSPPAEGFIGRTEEFKTDVGIWLMPDNQQDGKLETFLLTLVDENDALIGHAETATSTAKELGAEFSKPDTEKAVLHTWLAWQKEPGKPYGLALTHKFFGHDSHAANTFVAWFKRLYDIA